MVTEIVGLIPENEKASLKTATEAKAIADGAVLASTVAAIARQINDAVNSGEYKVKINYPLSADVISVIQANGYTIYPVGYAKPTDSYEIDWE